MARRGCNMIWPNELVRKAVATRRGTEPRCHSSHRSGDRPAHGSQRREPYGTGQAAPAGSRMLRSHPEPPGLRQVPCAPLVCARMRSSSAAGGSGRACAASPAKPPRAARRPATGCTARTRPYAHRSAPADRRPACRPARRPASPRTARTARCRWPGCRLSCPRTAKPSGCRNVCSSATYTTCPSIRCKSLASSPRPRLIRLFTVPSGMRSTCAISL